MRQDGLYIDGVNVGVVPYALTFQGNDLTKPDQRRASGSNQFTIADSLAMRDIMQGGEQPDAYGKNPYITKPAFIIENGERIFKGLAEFESFKGGWKINLLDALVGFWDGIKNKKLQDLDLSALNHKWTVDVINSFAGSAEGITYPLVDGGNMSGTDIPFDTMSPAVFLKTVVAKIAEESGYKLVGDWLKEWRYNHSVLPFVFGEANSYNQDWVNDRSARVTVVGRELGNKTDHIIPFVVDNNLAAGWTDGKKDNFKPSKNAYVCDTDMRIRVQAFQSFNVTVLSGAVEARLSVEKNGTNVGEVYWTSPPALYNGLGIKRESLDLDKEIECKAGDELRVRFFFDKRTFFGSYRVSLSETPETCWAAFIPNPAVHFNDAWPVARNLPDMTCSELLISVAKYMSGSYNVDDDRRTIELVLLNKVVENIPKAQDWSGLIDESTEPENLVKIDGYGQVNFLKWKAQAAKENIGFGDGKIYCNVGNLPAEETLFDLPLSAVLNSDKTLAGYGTPVLIPTRTVSQSDGKTTVTKKDAPACIILVEPRAVIEVDTKVLGADGESVVNAKIKLTAAWFSSRPNLAIREDNAYSMAFSPASINDREETLITSYFGTLQRVLRRPRVITLLVVPTPTDIAQLNLSVPIILQRVRVGSLDFNFGYYYLNQISGYRSNVSCPVTLIAL